MYRRHLRMVLIRDLESNKSRSEFVHRIASIPVVYLAWNIAAETYHNVKASNKFLRLSLNTTEKAANFITEPVIRRFEKQLKSADLIACRGFQALQDLVPNLRNQQQKLYKHTRDIYEDTVESGLRKYEIVKKISTNKFWNQGSEKLEEFRASPYGEVCELALDFALEAGEMYVDHYLPPLGDERPEKLFGDRGKEPVWKRTELLRNRIKERLYKHSLLKIQVLRLRTKYLIIRIYYFNMYQVIVNVSASLPGMIFATVTQTFSSLQDVIAYLSVLLRFNQRHREHLHDTHAYSQVI